MCARKTEQQEEFWITRDGRRIAVGDMEEDHVRDVLRMILRNRRRIAQLKRDLKAIAANPIDYWDWKD